MLYQHSKERRNLATLRQVSQMILLGAAILLAGCSAVKSAFVDPRVCSTQEQWAEIGIEVPEDGKCTSFRKFERLEREYYESLQKEQ